MSYLLDTNVICELVKRKPNKNVVQWIEQVPENALYLSVLTLGEIRKGIEKLHDRSRKEKLKIWLEFDLPNWFENRIISIDKQVAEKWGDLLGKSSRPLPAIDSLLAATALHYDLKLVTRNESDFHNLHVELINPWL